MREMIILLEVYPQLFHKEVLAKPPEWEGQRLRCPIRRRMGTEDAAPREFCKCLYNTGELITKHRDCLDSRK